MGKQILSNQDFYFGGYRLQSSFNEGAIDYGAEAPEVTTFGSGGTKEFMGGLKTLGGSAKGFFDPQAADAPLAANLALAGVPFTAVPTHAAEGEIAYFLQAINVGYSPQLTLGQPGEFTLTLQNTGRPGLVRGKAAVLNAGLAATGHGGAYQLGAVTTGKKLYAALHVFGVAGTDAPKISMKVQSDDNSNFTSATDRITFADVAAVGSQWASVAAPVTDDWWRGTFTITGTLPVFGVMLALGIR